VRTEFQTGDSTDLDRINADFASMQDMLARQLTACSVRPEDAAFRRSGDLRYLGQGYELRVPFPEDALDRDGLDAVFTRFGELHRTEYGHVFADSPIEIVNIRVTAIGRMAKIAAPRPPQGGSLGEALVKTAACVFRFDGELQSVPTPFYRRDALPPETAIAGPAIILQTDSTTVVPPGATAAADHGGNLILRLES
jgi:N-methylhydantoinase A